MIWVISGFSLKQYCQEANLTKLTIANAAPFVQAAKKKRGYLMAHLSL
jgi:hypothetical protein